MIDPARFPLAGQSTILSPEVTHSSPSFSAPYPAIVNSDLIPESIRADLESTWRTGVFSERTLEVFGIRNAIALNEGLVFDEHLRLISNSVDYTSKREIESALEVFGGEFERGGPRRYPGTTILVKKRAPNNYGHFLLEMLPLAFIGRVLFGDANPAYLLHRVSPQTEDAILRAFRLLNFGLDRLILTDYGDPAGFERLVFFRGLTEHGRYMSPLAVQIVEGLARAVPAGPPTRLFVRRAPGWGQGRVLLNEGEVALRLERCGYRSIEPGALSLEQQIAAFQGAERVIGVCGAALTNIVFCKPGTKVTILTPAAFPDTFFWFIATHKRLDLLEIRGHQRTYEGEESWKAGFTVAEQDIHLLERMN